MTLPQARARETKERLSSEKNAGRRAVNQRVKRDGKERQKGS